MEKVIKGNTYVIGKMDAFQQLHVARRLAPIQAENGVEAFARMEDKDVEYIYRTCLSVCQRRQTTGSGQTVVFAKVMANGVLMFSDIDYEHMQDIVTAVIEENLGGFSPTAQQ
jgi:hypothetical protein